MNTLLWAAVTFAPCFALSYVLFPNSQDIGKGIHLLLVPLPFLAWLAGVATLKRIIGEVRTSAAFERWSGLTLLKLCVPILLFTFSLSYMYTSCCGGRSPNLPITSRPNA